MSRAEGARELWKAKGTEGREGVEKWKTEAGRKTTRIEMLSKKNEELENELELTRKKLNAREALEQEKKSPI